VVYALNFSDDAFNPAELGNMDALIAKVPHGLFVLQTGSPESFGHLTMAHPELWANHVADFMQSLGHGN
jgi:homoserine O-acetyltransferase/O-succinyltransferase